MAPNNSDSWLYSGVPNQSVASRDICLCASSEMSSDAPVRRHLASTSNALPFFCFMDIMQSEHKGASGLQHHSHARVGATARFTVGSTTAAELDGDQGVAVESWSAASDSEHGQKLSLSFTSGSTPPSLSQLSAVLSSSSTSGTASDVPASECCLACRAAASCSASMMSVSVDGLP